MSKTVAMLTAFTSNVQASRASPPISTRFIRKLLAHVIPAVTVAKLNPHLNYDTGGTDLRPINFNSVDRSDMNFSRSAEAMWMRML